MATSNIHLPVTLYVLCGYGDIIWYPLWLRCDSGNPLEGTTDSYIWLLSFVVLIEQTNDFTWNNSYSYYHSLYVPIFYIVCMNTILAVQDISTTADAHITPTDSHFLWQAVFFITFLRSFFWSLSIALYGNYEATSTWWRVISIAHGYFVIFRDFIIWVLSINAGTALRCQWIH